jgi:ubiquitin C-terminal hydrolase
MGFFRSVKGILCCIAAKKTKRSPSVHAKEAHVSALPISPRQVMTSLTRRRQEEKLKFTRLEHESTRRLYSFLDAAWMRKWVNFTEKGLEMPGAISHQDLLHEGKLREGLLETKDFVVLSKSRYTYLHSCYRGDLPISSITQDIYQAQLPNKSELPSSSVRDTGELGCSNDEMTAPNVYKRGFNLLELRASKNRSRASSKLEGGRDFTEVKVPVTEAKPHSKVAPSLFDEERTSLNSRVARSKCRSAAGFYNPSNYCFMNAALQCLFSVAPFADNFLSRSFSRDAVKKTRLSDSLAQVAESYFLSDDVVRPEVLWRLSSGKFPVGRQHDLPEFLRFILEGLEVELKVEERPAASWEDYENYYNQMLVTTFEGETVQDVTCMKCGFVSKSKEIFTDIALELTSSVELSLERYTAAEFIRKTNYKCEKCSRNTDITKQTRFLRLPNYLILQIKRFESGTYPRKSNAPMTFADTMTVLGDEGGVRYRLIAVAVHHGS